MEDGYNRLEFLSVGIVYSVNANKKGRSQVASITITDYWILVGARNLYKY